MKINRTRKLKNRKFSFMSVHIPVLPSTGPNSNLSYRPRFLIPFTESYHNRGVRLHLRWYDMLTHCCLLSCCLPSRHLKPELPPMPRSKELTVDGKQEAQGGPATESWMFLYVRHSRFWVLMSGNSLSAPFRCVPVDTPFQDDYVILWRSCEISKGCPFFI